MFSLLPLTSPQGQLKQDQALFGKCKDLEASRVVDILRDLIS